MRAQMSAWENKTLIRTCMDLQEGHNYQASTANSVCGTSAASSPVRPPAAGSYCNRAAAELHQQSRCHGCTYLVLMAPRGGCSFARQVQLEQLKCNCCHGLAVLVGTANRLYTSPCFASINTMCGLGAVDVAGQACKEQQKKHVFLVLMQSIPSWG
jgi:hypothetical protein